MKRMHTTMTVIPALPGYQLVAIDWEEKEVFLSASIIAWRIETIEWDEDGWTRYTSTACPISVNGEPCSNEGGTMAPDGTIVYADGHYDNLEDMRNRLFQGGAPVDSEGGS